jgi:hypothetical protein
MRRANSDRARHRRGASLCSSFACARPHADPVVGRAARLRVRVQSGQLEKAIDSLIVLEKQARVVRSQIQIQATQRSRLTQQLLVQAQDIHSTARILVVIVQMCKEAGNWTALNEQIQLLSKRRGQLKFAVTKLVQEAMTYLTSTPDEEHLITLIETLRAVSAGKVSIPWLRTSTRVLTHVSSCTGRFTSKWNALA